MLVPLLLVSLSYCLAFCGASALPSPQGQSDGRTYSVQSAADRAEVVAVTILEKGGTHWMFVINEYAGMQAVRQNFCYDDESTSVSISAVALGPVFKESAFHMLPKAPFALV